MKKQECYYRTNQQKTSPGNLVETLEDKSSTVSLSTDIPLLQSCIVFFARPFECFLWPFFPSSILSRGPDCELTCTMVAVTGVRFAVVFRAPVVVVHAAAVVAVVCLRHSPFVPRLLGCSASLIPWSLLLWRFSGCIFPWMPCR